MENKSCEVLEDTGVIHRSYPVEDPECLSDFVFRVLVRILLGHEGEEGGKLEVTCGLFVHFVHHVLQICLELENKVKMVRINDSDLNSWWLKRIRPGNECD